MAICRNLNLKIRMKSYILYWIVVSLLLISSFPIYGKDVRHTASGKIIVTFYQVDDQGIPYGYAITNWPEEAIKGVMEAMTIVESTLVLAHTMKVGFIWTADLQEKNYVGAAHSKYYDIRGIGALAHLDGYFNYPGELARQLTGYSIFAGENITIVLNALKDWCPNSGREPEWYEQDLITVTLHELVHGLGMSSSFTKTATTRPYIFDKFIRTSSGESIAHSFIPLKQNREVELAGIELFYGGEYGILANNGEPIQLHTPSKFSKSSLCHFDKKYGENPEGCLMIPGTKYGENTRLFGDLVRGVLEDIGWKLHPNTRSNDATSTGVIISAEAIVRTGNSVIWVEMPDLVRKEISIYTMNGKLIIRKEVTHSTSFDVAPGMIYIVRIGNKSYKLFVE